MLSVIGILLPMNALAQILQVRTLPVQANDLIYSESLQRIIAVTPADADTLPNSVVIFDPISMGIDTSFTVQEDPDILALTDDHNTLYVGFHEDNVIIKVDLLTSEILQTIDLGGDASNDFRARDIEVLPGNPDVIAVSLESISRFSSHHQYVAIFDNGIPRPNVTYRIPEIDYLTSGDNPNRLYGYSRPGSANYFSRLVVDDEGVETESYDVNLLEGFREIFYSEGRVYDSAGHVIDPEKGELIGQFAQNIGLHLISDFIVDPVLDRTFYLQQGEGDEAVIVVFDNDTFACLATLTLEEIEIDDSQRNRQIIRWGESGLAFNNSPGQVVVLESLIADPLLPVLYPSSSTLFFDGVTEDTDKPILITNPGTATLVVDAVQTTHPAFSFSPSSFSLEAGASMQGTVTFSPPTYGLTEAELHFSHNTVASPSVLSVKGIAEVKSVVLEPNEVDFGEVAQFQEMSLPVAITNNGVESVSISSIRSSNPHFLVADTSLVLQGSEQVSLTVNLSSTLTDEQSGFIIVESDAITRSDSISVKGSRQTAPLLSINTANIVLGEVPAGVEVDTMFQIVNQGLDTLQISSIASSNEDFIPSSTSLTVLPAASMDLGIKFLATKPGSNWATIRLESNALSSPDTLYIAAQVVSTVSVVAADNPAVFSLGQNYPNPVFQSTSIPFELPETAEVNIVLYDALGRKIMTLLDRSMPPGQHAIGLDASKLTNGVYVYRIATAGKELSKVMIVLQGK